MYIYNLYSHLFQCCELWIGWLQLCLDLLQVFLCNFILSVQIWNFSVKTFTLLSVITGHDTPFISFSFFLSSLFYRTNKILLAWIDSSKIVLTSSVEPAPPPPAAPFDEIFNSFWSDLIVVLSAYQKDRCMLLQSYVWFHATIVYQLTCCCFLKSLTCCRSFFNSSWNFGSPWAD
jgi:hypothetical protein